MVTALFDTNILIDYLNGSAEARAELRRYDAPAISVVTWMEIMVGATPETDSTLRSFLATFQLVGLDAQVAEAAVDLRRRFRMRLPDAIVWASARARGSLLVTRNTKDFPSDDPGVRSPYVI